MNVNPEPGRVRPPRWQTLPGSFRPQPAPVQPTVDLSQDPVLQQIHAFEQKQIADAQANQLAGVKQALIGYGYDPSLTSLYPDPSTAQAAQQNPFSVLTNLAHAHEQQTTQLEDALNKNNLFYSGHRATALGENARQYQQQQTTAAGNLQHQLSALAQQLLGVQNTASENELAGYQNAYNRYNPPDSQQMTPALSHQPPPLLSSLVQQRRPAPLPHLPHYGSTLPI